MTVPGGAGARHKCQPRRTHAGGVGGVEDRIDADLTGEIFLGALPRRLRAATFDLHGHPHSLMSPAGKPDQYHIFSECPFESDICSRSFVQSGMRLLGTERKKASPQVLEFQVPKAEVIDWMKQYPTNGMPDDKRKKCCKNEPECHSMARREQKQGDHSRNVPGPLQHGHGLPRVDPISHVPDLNRHRTCYRHDRPPLAMAWAPRAWTTAR